MATRGGVFDPIEESVGNVIERLRALQEEFGRTAASAAKLGASTRDAAESVNRLAESAATATGAVSQLGASSSSVAEDARDNAISGSMTSQINARTGRVPIT